MWAELTDNEREALYLKSLRGVPLDNDADELGIQLQSLERYLRSYRRKRALRLQTLAAEITIPASTSPIVNTPPTLTTDNAIIIADVEIPDHHAGILQTAVYLGMAQNIRQLIILGDFIATDQDAMNFYARHVVTGGESSYPDDIKLMRAVLREMLKWFDSILYICGNHDARVTKTTKGQIHLDLFLMDMPAVTYTPYGNCWLETSRGPIWALHPKNYRADPVLLCQQLYDRQPRKCHVLVAHTHRWQSGMSADGAYQMHAIGCARDMARTAYINLPGGDKHKKWDYGLFMLCNGYQYNLAYHATDWSLWLNDVYAQWLSEQQTATAS